MIEVRFDDIPQLTSLISDEFGPWGNEISVPQQMIDQFAELTGDHQWIHTDVERATKESPFGGTIAHGFLTLSLMPTMHALNQIKIIGHQSGTNYGAGGLRFLAPVPSGSLLHARSRLSAVEERSKGVLLTYEVAIHVVGVDKPALLYSLQLLYR